MDDNPYRSPTALPEKAAPLKLGTSVASGAAVGAFVPIAIMCAIAIADEDRLTTWRFAAAAVFSMGAGTAAGALGGALFQMVANKLAGRPTPELDDL